MTKDEITTWALANGWSGQNPALLAKYVKDINSGKRPRCSRVISSDYVDHLRERVAGGFEDGKS
mgnify:CR=1 FL=1